MAITRITYADKSALNVNASVADTNKVNATDMNEIKSVVNNNATNIGDMDNLVGATNLVDKANNLSPVVLWQSTATTIGATTLSLSGDDYDYAIIHCYRNGSSSTSRTVSFIGEKGKEVDLSYSDYSGSLRSMNRTIILNDTTATTTACTLSQASQTTNNACLCPYKIVGYKY